MRRGTLLPILSLRKRPTGTVRVPVTATGVRSVIDASRVFGTTLAHWFELRIISSISSSGTSFSI